ncbi:MAG: sigma 54-interacting transcriptional regulator [Actinobacteria bacterium]|nr:sigma 54-interacting transcriptional regulator [Actinomycetota bacterium]
MTASTLGELKASGWRDRSVKDEIRENFIARVRAGEQVFLGIIGYDDTVIPALERALLAGHDTIFLGERGQAKSRLIRALVELLDERTPVVAGCEINDSPLRPICAHCRALVATEGDNTPVVWIARDKRYAEKLATPDTSVADLIGDVDPIRVAEGRYLSDELTIHYGLVPRTHRGIFSINELPDLPERIQVGLLNILEERDVQIRGYNVRLPLDLLLVASANPEDYTNRGRIISPLKDRFGSEVRTHYPDDPIDEIEIMEQESKPPAPGIAVSVPPFIAEVIAEFTHQLRRSPHVNQRSGVSVRFSIGGLETIRASAVRRAIRTGEEEAVPRLSDLPAVISSSMGRVEFESFEEGREPEILDQLARKAVLDVFRRRLGGFDFASLLSSFDGGGTVDTGDLVPSADLLKQLGDVPGSLLKRLGVSHESPALAASAFEFALEGLHLSRRLNKARTATGARYGG